MKKFLQKSKVRKRLLAGVLTATLTVTLLLAERIMAESVDIVEEAEEAAEVYWQIHV